MDQLNLIHEDIYDAIRTAVQALGGAKKVGAMLWPDKMPDKAGEWLNSCLNQSRPEKLDPEQVLFIARAARQVGCHVVADYFASDCGYQFTPIEPKDEVAELQRQYIEAAKTIHALTSRIEKINLKAV